MRLAYRAPTGSRIRAGLGAALEWGVGSAVGTFASDLWTPGRDSNGRVNFVSLALLPTNRWVQVDGTRLDGLDSVVKAGVTGWGDSGSGGWDGVTNAWSGFAIDHAGGRLWLMGGGHNDSSNNGVYRFDVTKMAWSCERLPSDTTAWSSAYKTSGSFGNCAESTAQMTADYNAGTWAPINGWGKDELFWDRQPCARHAYGSMVYSAVTNELVMAHYRLWRFSLASKQWTYKRAIRDSYATWLDSENGVATLDEATGEVLVSACGATISSGSATGYALASNTWTDWSSPWANQARVADVRVGRSMVVVLPPTSGDVDYSASRGAYWVYNLDSRTTTQTGSFQFAGGLTSAAFALTRWYYDGASLVYIPSRNVYWLWTGTNAYGADDKIVMMCVEIDPTTTPWTIRPASAETLAGAKPVPSPALKRKTVYLSSIDSVLLCDRASRNVYLYRLS